MRQTVAVDLRALVPEPTGIGVYTLEMLRQLTALGSFDYLGLAHREPRGARELAELGVSLEHQSAPLGVLWQQLLLPRRLAAGDVDLLWSPLQTLPMHCPVPAVLTVYDLTVLLLPDTHRSKVRWSQIPFLERSIQAARQVVTISESSARDLRFHFPQAFQGDGARRDKLHVIPPGVSPDFRPATDDERQAIRAELGCPGGYILYAGTLEPRKNVAALLDAWLALRAGDGGAPPLVLAGGYGWRSRGLVRRIERLRRAPELRGELHVLGRVDRDRLLRLFRGATLFAYPSYYEGFGMPVAEAMASGVPVVTSDRSSLPEVIGDAGLTARPEDPGAIAGALRHVLGDPARAADLAARGIERARTFRWDKSAQQMDEVLRAAVD